MVLQALEELRKELICSRKGRVVRREERLETFRTSAHIKRKCYKKIRRRRKRRRKLWLLNFNTINNEIVFVAGSSAFVIHPPSLY
jgi:hypothetical protein